MNYNIRNLQPAIDIFVSAILPIIFVIISFIWYKKYTIQEPVVKSTEFYPPDNLSSMEVGHIYHSVRMRWNFVSYLFALANKGYLHITDIEERIPNELLIPTNRKGFKLTKLKEYDGVDDYEKYFFTGLFCFASQENPNEVTSEQLFMNFYPIMDALEIKKIKDSTLPSLTSPPHTSWPMIIFTAILITSRAFLIRWPNFSDALLLIFLSFFLLLMLWFFLDSFINHRNWYTGYRYTVSRINYHTLPGHGVFTFLIALLSGLGSIIFLVHLLVFPELNDPSCTYYNNFTSYNNITSIIFLTCLIVIQFFFVKACDKKSDYAIEMTGRVIGFRDFLLHATKEELEAQLRQNPNYFYDMLPYAYVLDVADDYIRNFEGLVDTPPLWYTTDTPFSIRSFANSFKTISDIANLYLTVRPHYKEL